MKSNYFEVTVYGETKEAIEKLNKFSEDCVEEMKVIIQNISGETVELSSDDFMVLFNQN